MGGWVGTLAPPPLWRGLGQRLGLKNLFQCFWLILGGFLVGWVGWLVGWPTLGGFWWAGFQKKWVAGFGCPASFGHHPSFGFFSEGFSSPHVSFDIPVERRSFLPFGQRKEVQIPSLQCKYPGGPYLGGQRSPEQRHGQVNRIFAPKLAFLALSATFGQNGGPLIFPERANLRSLEQQSDLWRLEMEGVTFQGSKVPHCLGRDLFWPSPPAEV